MPHAGIHSVTVPGAVAGWDAMLHALRHACRFADVLAPGDRLRRATASRSASCDRARTGATADDNLVAEPSAARVFLPDGRAPEVGEIFRNPDLAASLRRDRQGRQRRLLQGRDRERILATSARHGGTMTADDLARVRRRNGSSRSRPTYRGWTVYELPPNDAGHRGADDAQHHGAVPARRVRVHNSREALHVMIEAKKLAYADMLRYVADPALRQGAGRRACLDKAYGRERAQARSIRAQRATCSRRPRRASRLAGARHDLSARSSIATATWCR